MLITYATELGVSMCKFVTLHHYYYICIIIANMPIIFNNKITVIYHNNAIRKFTQKHSHYNHTSEFTSSKILVWNALSFSRYLSGMLM